MRTKETTLFCLGLLVIFTSYLFAQGSQKVTCTGKVTDAQGQPVAGARVGLYKINVTMETLSYDASLSQELASKDDGTFIIEAQADSSDLTGQAIILVQKEGLAMGWYDWQLTQNADVKIILDKANILAGRVVDEARKPVADAEVAVSFMVVRAQEESQFLIGKVLPELKVKTDQDGKFSFKNIPGNATAEFVIKKPGMALVSTLDIENAGETLKFSAGQADIEIILPVEAKIEGTVIEKASGKSLAGVRLMATKGRRPQPFLQETYVSKEDGTFSIDSLTAGALMVQVVSPVEGLADWISEPVEVTTEAGKTTSGVKLELSKGGVLEVKVMEADDKKPIEKASIVIQQPGGDVSVGATSDKDGIAKIRLNPGQYQIVQIYKQGFTIRGNLQEPVTIEEGKTAAVEYQLAGQPKITGVVRDGTGKPVEGVKLKVCPMGRDGATSNAEGRFEVTWDPRSWSPEIPVMYLIAMYKEGNLATAVEVQDDTRTQDLQLEPAVTLAGKVVDPNGKGIPEARISIMLRASSWGSTIGSSMAPVDNDGNFEAKAVPDGQRYSINARADGYGESRIEVDTENAVNNRLDAGTLTLPVANLSVSGIVVDVDGKPVAGARVSSSGEGQSYQNAQTDAEGKFKLDKICAGRVQVYADKSGQTRVYGSVQTEGGASDVKIVISESASSSRYAPKQPPSLVGKPLPELKDLGVEPLPDAADKIVLVCFFDYEQRPSRNCIVQLSKRAQELKEKGIIIIAVQASKIEKNKLDEWIKAQNIPFPVGMIEGDSEKIQFSWGVRSLPWLILTNKQHIIAAGGFSITELDKRIGALENAAQ